MHVIKCLCTQAQEIPRSDETADPSHDETTVAVTISLLDLNDVRPQFSSASSEAMVREELPAGSPVNWATPLTVLDPDQVRCV